MTRYYEFEVSLDDIEPRIWRRFLLRHGASFLDLHYAIQDAGPWHNDHLFAFYANHRLEETIATAGEDSEPWTDEAMPAAEDVPLESFFKRTRQKCVYVYDFGDSWSHTVELKKIADLPEEFERRLLGGARAWPLEDCGGVGGYYNCLQVKTLSKQDLKKKENEHLLDYVEWVGHWDPEHFDLEAARKKFDS